MDRNAAGLYGSLLWTVGSAFGSALAVYMAIVSFQTSFQAGAEAARTGVPLSTEAATQSAIGFLASLQPALVLTGIVLAVGSVPLLIGLDEWRRKLRGALGTAVLVTGCAYLAALLGSLGVDAFIGLEARLRSAMGGGFNPYFLALGIVGALIPILFNILTGVFIFTHRRVLPHPARAAGILLILGFIPFVQTAGFALLVLLFHRLRRSPLPAVGAAEAEARRPTEEGDVGPIPASPQGSAGRRGAAGRGVGSGLHSFGFWGSLVLAVGSALTTALWMYTVTLFFQSAIQLGHQVAEANQSGHPIPRETIRQMSGEAARNFFGPVQPLLWTVAWILWAVGIGLLLVGLVGLRKRFPGALLPVVFAFGLLTLIPVLGHLLGIVFGILLGSLLLVHRRTIPGPALAGGILFILFFIPFLGSVAFACLAWIFRRLRTTPLAVALPTPAPASEPQPQRPPPGKRFCTDCGSPLAEGTKFCGSCGARV